MCKSFHTLLLSIVISCSAMASTNEHSTKWNDNLQQVESDNLYKEVGRATYSVLLWDVYKSELLTSSGNFALNATGEDLIYKINYFMDISAEELVDLTVEQWEHLELDKSRYTPYLADLARLFPDIKKGDTLALLSNQHGSAFYYNNKLMGSIDNTEFSPLFLSIWLSPNTSEPELRKTLLGENSDD